MKRTRVIAAREPYDEITTLARQLDRTQQQLQKLTGGEVDSILLPGGQSYLLHEAQEKLRQNDAMQASILNALPVHIALIDAQGTIISVNEGWQHFAERNGLQNASSGVGQNYLEICERATGAGAVESQRAAAGIRMVLQGETGEFALEYPCHSPAEQHWFRLMANTLIEGGRGGAVVMHIDITERKLLENAVRESEERLNFALNSAGMGDWSLDLLTNVTSRSLRHDQCFGYRELLPVWSYDTFLAHVDPADREHVDNCFKTAMAGQGEYDDEVRTTWPDGTVHWLWTKGHFYFDEKGKPYRVAGIVTDVTARKQVEEALRRSEEEFRTLAEAVPQIVWATRADGYNIYFSQRWMDYTGLTLEESRGHGWSKPFHPDDQQMALDAWEHATATISIYSIECRLRRADGVYCWWLIRGEPLLDAVGHVLKWFGTCTNIDELKQAQIQITEQAALIDEARDAIVVRDLEHRITFWSKGAERLYGWTADEAGGDLLQKLLQMDEEKFGEASHIVLENAEWNGELQKTARNGMVHTLDCRWTLLRNASGEPRSILSIDTDITERKKLEHQFLRSQRMESIGTLAGGIAHDLNNVLSPIIMSIELLQMKFPDKAGQELLAIISSSAQRGADMVRQVLSFARGVEGKRIEVQIKHLLQDIEKISRDTFQKNIRVHLILPGDLWTVLGDPTQLHQVLLNLCVNARDAMPDGGTLTLSAENVTLDAQYAGLNHDATAGPYVAFQVEDSGTGMPPAVIEKIFDPFFTTKELGKGTGLGLSTTLAIVKSHGGFLRVYSEMGKGTKFKVYLPGTKEKSEAAIAAAEAEMPRGHGEWILVVDDEPSVRLITQQTLEAFGYRTISAVDGADALAIYVMRKGEIAVVLTDMMMPVMDGPALIRVLLKLTPTVRIIGASGLAANEQVVNLGVKHFLPKPYTADVLLRTLRQVLEGAAQPAG